MATIQSTATSPVVSMGFPGGVRAIIRAARTPLPGPDLSAQPVRAFVARTCTAEVEHAEADFWWVVRRLQAEVLFDRDAEPDCEAAFRLPHEQHAGAALLWLSHLQAHASDWTRRWRAMSPAGKRDWLRRRRYLLGGLIPTANAYRASRASYEGGAQ